MIPDERSDPLILFASACGYHVFEYGAFAKPAWTVLAPADPSVALTAEQLSGSMVASTLMVTALVSCAPQRLAA